VPWSGGAWETSVDVQEIRKIENYLKRLFGNARIRVVPQPKKDDSAEVYIGEEKLGELGIDDDEDDRSYNLRMEFRIGKIDDVRQLDAYFRRKFDNEHIHIVRRARKQDSMDVHLKDEFIGVVFIENEDGEPSYILELPILEIDLEEPLGER
jgi:Protein of unknown function (DUF3126)